MGARRLFESISTNNIIKRLYCNRNQLQSKSLPAITKFLWENKSLTHLYLNSSEITKEIANSIGEGIAKNITLEYLSMNGNNI